MDHTAAQRPFIGWRIIGVGSLCYGFGISPAYYGWGLFLPDMLNDIELTGAQSGFVFSVFGWIYHLLGPLVGMAMARWGIRSMMVPGLAIGTLAFWLMSRADSWADCLLAFGVLGGISIGMGTILAAQNLASNWFVRQRARALAIVLGGGAIVGYGVNKWFVPEVLRVADWRTGWLIIAGISAVVAVVAALFIRGAPEKVGQLPDGGPAPAVNAAATEDADTEKAEEGAGEWTAPLALRTSQFYILVLLAIAYGAPWGVITAFGPLHLESLGFTTAMIGSILGARLLVSLFGRFSASLGDYMPPQRLLGIVLVLEGLGCAGLIVADTTLLAYISVILVGLGFGAAYVSIPVVFSAFYGRRAFGTAIGIRFAITGLVGPAIPTLAGQLADWYGSHILNFALLAAFCILSAFIAFGLRAPVLRTPQVKPAAATG